MRYLVLVSHGDFAKGLKTSLAMFAPDKMDSVIAVGLENGKGADDFAQEFRSAMSVLKEEDDLVLLADIVGGSPLTTALNVLNELGRYDNTVVLGGMNLPMALTMAVMKDNLSGEALKATVLGEAKGGIQEFDTTPADAAEDEENKSKVHSINVLGTQYIAEAAKSVDAKMLYLSTDYVFDGKGDRPWEPDDKCYAPLNVYGQSKLDGELTVSSLLEKYFIVRIAWVFGLNGNNFIKTMINLGKTHDTVRVVNDQIGTPTYTLDLSRLLVDMVETDKYGYYHATNEGGYISWYDFCVEFYKQYGLDTKVIPVTTEEYGLSKAARPFNSRLDKSKLVESGFVPLPDWKDAVRRYLMEADL